MIKYNFLFVLLSISFLCNAQDRSYKLVFNLLYGENEIGQGKKICLEKDYWITFTKFKFYIGNPVYFEKGRLINTVQNRYDLLDFSDSTALTVEYSVPSSTDSLCVSIGTDSLTNVSGLYDGALDPLNGMYWAWNSGYINVKIEGTSTYVSNDDHKFEFHIGGYMSPYTTERQICITPYSQIIHLNIDVSKVIDSNLLIDTPSITIPGKNASSFSDAFKMSFFQLKP